MQPVQMAKELEEEGYLLYTLLAMITIFFLRMIMMMMIDDLRPLLRIR